MLLVLAQIALGLVALFFGGEWLVRGASALAARFGVSPLAVGLTIVAFGTSLPELVVSVDAALSEASEIAVGNVVGSNIANVAFILGLAALLRPVQVVAKVVRIDTPLMVGASLALLAILADGFASRLEGVLLLLGLVAFTGFTFWEARRESDDVQQEFASVTPEARASAVASGALVAAGLAVLLVGGHLLVIGAVALAEGFGVPQATIGLTIVAIGTSLPEVATSVLAAWRGQGDIAVGNVVGSNLFNMLGILGLTAVIHPLRSGEVGLADLATMVGLAVALGLLLWRRGGLGHAEGGLLLGSYALYTGWLVARS